MRVKSDARRQAIVDAATELFREVGFERASMAQISARAGGSKATLYSYFGSKEELFAAAMVDSMAEQADAMIALLEDPGEDLTATFTRFGLAYLQLIGSGQCVCSIRTAISESSNGELGPVLYRMGPRRGMEEIAEHIERLMAQGRLSKGDPLLAAMQFKGLLDAGSWEPRLFGAPQEFDDEMAVKAAVRTFLRGYAPEAEG
ncbi:MAG TPA: TetR/AcrR family transcriptional regulator [Novosphingobium sp.]|nr:TetR/AcrR family transcriptional regulator [Novosphingobium sp.]